MVTKFAEGAAEAGGSREGGGRRDSQEGVGFWPTAKASCECDRKNWQVASEERRRRLEGRRGSRRGALDNCALRLAVAVVLAVDTVGTVACLGGWRLLHSLYNYFKHSIGIRPQEATAGYVCARPQLYPFKCNNRHQARIRMGMAVQ